MLAGLSSRWTLRIPPGFWPKATALKATIAAMIRNAAVIGVSLISRIAGFPRLAARPYETIEEIAALRHPAAVLD
jgi:hypothetical protein